MTYAEAIQFLYELRWFGTKLGLENTFKLAGLAGNPQDQLRFIHVAGTNGKGSTCAMLESIYRTAGLRVGLFTSPHLVSFGERIQVNRSHISEAEVVRLVGELQPLLKRFPAEAHPTFFEMVTVMALRYFAEQRCDLVIWETGLGGRLDATNIVTPLASVITNIGLDHEQWLGETLDKIAFEKAGIIKPGVPVITAARLRSGLEAITETARKNQSPLTTVDLAEADRPPLDTVKLPLLGQFQKLNAAVAAATVRVLSATASRHGRGGERGGDLKAKQISVPDDIIVAGLSAVNWPGRMQLVNHSAGQRVLLDGAHNPAGAEALCQELEKQFYGAAPAIIFGILRDKDWKRVAALLAARARCLFLVPIQSERSLSPAELLPVCEQANAAAPALACSSLKEALERTADDPFVVITGSLYLVGEALELWRLSSTLAPDERGLNEWGAPRLPVRKPE
jgi:dihydrofolate synthase/folylpolyglutamate synthase